MIAIYIVNANGFRIVVRQCPKYCWYAFVIAFGLSGDKVVLDSCVYLRYNTGLEPGFYLANKQGTIISQLK